jgi:hypothetical protein
MSAAEDFNRRHPVGTPVTYWPGDRQGPGQTSRTRTPAWTLAHGAAVVSVEDYSGGISLTHVEPITPAQTSEETR